MLVPASRAFRSAGTDFTVLVSLTVGLLLWLVLACFGLARLQQQATMQLQRAAARVVVAELAPLVTSGGTLAGALASRPDLRALADSTGLHVAMDSMPTAATTTGIVDASVITQAIAGALVTRPVQVQGVSRTLVVNRAVERGGVALAPVGPQVLMALVVALLAITTTIGGALLVRLRREHVASSVRSTFASAVSHELRTPLAQILLFAETLQLGRTRSDADRTLALGAIVQEARRLMRLVDNVLRFTRLEQGPPALRQEPVAVDTLVQDTARQFAPLAESSDVAIAVHAPVAAVALADADAVRQVLLNLLDNAVKHGPRAQRITARVETRAAHVRLSVEDEGPGIAPGDQGRIWQPFTQGRRAGEATGAGLGLMIVRSLTEAMGGRVSCEPVARDGRGARFVVELPMASTLAAQGAS
ncbi:MAG: HAMP domain-containing histidine kinase [Gemmatimonadaceae bacterium]|nr:HAMP domain-containing histidine kinase [Gemmatimonadaceae bacterium]